MGTRDPHSPLRIGVNCLHLQKDIGGMRQYFRYLFDELLEKDERHRYVFFFAERNREELGRLKTDRWEREGILVEDQDGIAAHLDKMDLYFCPFSILWPLPVPRPSVVSFHDLQDKFFPEFFSPTDIWNREYHFRPSTRTADQVITISAFSKASIVRFHGVPPRKVHVAYSSPDRIYSQSTGEGMAPAGAWPRLPERFLFYPANRWLHKNHDALLRALCVLRKEYGLEIPCVMTGHHAEGGYPLHEKIREYRLENSVFDLGYVTQGQVRWLYSRAAMLVFVSLFEGFGLPLVEAMASGCPIACSKAASIPEVVGEAGLFFDPTDPREIAKTVFSLYHDTALCLRLREKGLARVRVFSPEAMALTHVRVFDLAHETYSPLRYRYYRHVYHPLHRFRMKTRAARERPGAK